MSSKRLLTLVMGIVIVSCASTLVGQVNIPSARFDPKPVDSFKNTRPLAEPGVFNYDAQVFAPLEFTNNEELEPNVGFYFLYDRLYTAITKADARTAVGVPSGSNYSWGNRFELGWMTKQGDGWGAVYENTFGGFFASGQDQTIQQPLLVTTSFANVEFNRMFRQATSRGGSFEPYVGFRFNSISDNTIEDFTGARFKQNATNDLFGAHVGGRYSNRRGRFRTTLDAAALASYNRQTYFANDITFLGGAIAVNEAYDDDTSFVPGCDLRAEIAYNMSRDLSLRTGFQLIYLIDGVNRADTQPTLTNPNSIISGIAGPTGVNDEGFAAASFTFGVEWKR